jgi:hypothetical protein
MKKLVIICVTLLSLSGACSAQQDAKNKTLVTPQTKAAIEKVFALTDMNAMMGQVYSQLDSAFSQSLKTLKTPHHKQPLMEQYFNKYKMLMREELNWEKVKGPLINAYAEVFDLQDIEQLIAFYQSPVGRKMLKKMPELMQVSNKMVEQSMLNFLPQMEQLQQNMVLEFAQLD